MKTSWMIVGLAVALFAPRVEAAVKGIWLTHQEITKLPTSGAAWAALEDSATANWRDPDLRDQDRKVNTNVLAGALFYARTGNLNMRQQVADAIMDARRTLDVPSDWNCEGKDPTSQYCQNGALSLGRQLAAYVIAADLIDLQAFLPDSDVVFRNWLAAIRTQDVGTQENRSNLVETHEHAPNNWGTHCGASLAAAHWYLGDVDGLVRVFNVFRAWLGDPTSPFRFDPGDFGGGGSPDLSWQCDESNPVAVNPQGCTKLYQGQTYSIDGALPEEMRRGM